jgi:hypothetical protein
MSPRGSPAAGGSLVLTESRPSYIVDNTNIGGYMSIDEMVEIADQARREQNGSY